MIKATIGKETYMAFNERHLVEQLKLEDWTDYSGIKEYKRNIKKRIKVFSGEIITYNTDKEFLLELKRIGFFNELTFE